MIKVTKQKEPNILIVNRISWTQELLDEITAVGDYDSLSKETKELIASRYKHPEIKDYLIPIQDTKCVFCETIPNESGYVEVEHFLPKSIYPEDTFLWENLLPSCKRCNLKKLSLDTKIYPIVKPDVDDPEDYFKYNNIKIECKEDAPDIDKGKRTISRLELNQYRLIKPRSVLLVSLVEYETALEKTIEEYKVAKRSNKRNRIITNIMESIDKIDDLCSDEQKHAGFCRYYIKNNSVISEAKLLIKQYEESL